MEGLGRFNLRKLLRQNPFAPPGAALFLQEKKKSFAPPPTVSPTATGVDTVTPQAATPYPPQMPYYGYPQAPMQPYGYPQAPMQPYGYPQAPMPQYPAGPFAPPPQYQAPVQAPVQESATYGPGDYIPPVQPSAVDTGGPFDTADTSPTALMLDSGDTSMEGLGADGGWSDIFTGAAQEVLAAQKAKRMAKAQAALPTVVAKPRVSAAGGGLFTPLNIALVGAAGIGAWFLMRKRKRR